MSRFEQFTEEELVSLRSIVEYSLGKLNSNEEKVGIDLLNEINEELGITT